jgi:periplasmic protein CpxP/Spy
MAFTSRRLATAAFIAALALPVLAQNSSTVPAGENNATSATAAQQRQAGTPARMQERMAKRMARHLADFKAQLQITPAQEAAWATFADTMQSARRGPGMNRQDMAALTTPERIDRMRELRAQRMAEADRHGDATKALYNTLSPAQQKTFDEHSLRHHRKGFGKGDGKQMGRGDHGAMHGMHRMQ